MVFWLSFSFLRPSVGLFFKVSIVAYVSPSLLPFLVFMILSIRLWFSGSYSLMGFQLSFSFLRLLLYYSWKSLLFLKFPLLFFLSCRLFFFQFVYSLQLNLSLSRSLQLDSPCTSLCPLSLALPSIYSPLLSLPLPSPYSPLHTFFLPSQLSLLPIVLYSPFSLLYLALPSLYPPLLSLPYLTLPQSPFSLPSPAPFSQLSLALLLYLTFPLYLTLPYSLLPTLPCSPYSPFSLAPPPHPARRGGNRCDGSSARGNRNHLFLPPL